jgi:hypothetical protein
MRTHQLYLDQVRRKIKEFQAFERRLEQTLTREYEDISEDENHAIWLEHERIFGFDPDGEVEVAPLSPEDEAILEAVIKAKQKE